MKIKQDEVLLAVEAGRRVCWDSPGISENCHSSFFFNFRTDLRTPDKSAVTAGHLKIQPMLRYPVLFFFF